MTAATDILSPAGATGLAGKSAFRLFWDRFREDKAALSALVVIFVLVLIALIGGPLAAHITGHPSLEEYDNTMENSFGIPKGPNSQFWFGADGNGRDLFVRTMYGVRTSLTVGVVAAGISVSIGLVVGMIAGFFRGWIDSLLSRFGDVMLSMPQLLISIGIVAACSTSKEGCRIGFSWLHYDLQPGMPVVIAVIVIFTWPYIARIVRGFTLSIREREFVEASRSLGASNTRIIFREIMPNLGGPMLVWATLTIPQAILFEAALSYLGLGVPPDTASLGGLLDQATQYYDVAWWLVVFPGVFLVIITLAFNLLGDGLRDALDVRADR
jgi:ABC-type dipeptide/oligopeptide/nickel transport system permease subunit